MNIAQLYKIFLQYPDIITDSRQARPGSIFFALKGDRFDANRFAEKAVEDGCEYAVVDDPGLKDRKAMIYVEDVLVSLQKLAVIHRENFKHPVIGITGTNGKTTTKELIRDVLSQKYQVLATEGNYNNHIGVPLTLLKLKTEHEIAVVEMGANHPGEIDFLCRIASPDIGLITNIGKAHLEGFGSFDGVVETKKELYDFIEKKKGRLVINNSDSVLKAIAGAKIACSYGRDANADVFGKLIPGKINLSFEWSKEGEDIYRIDTSLVGDYNLDNVLAAIAFGLIFKVNIKQINHALQSYQPKNNRSQFLETRKNKLVVDAYNANPTSMKLAMENFSKTEGSNKYMILGDMFELGQDSEEEHQRIVDWVMRQGLNERVILIGEHFCRVLKSNTHGMTCYHHTDDFIKALEKVDIEKALILIKGSRGMKLERLIPYL